MITYIDGPEVKITENDGIFVDVEFFHSKEKTFVPKSDEKDMKSD